LENLNEKSLTRGETFNWQIGSNWFVPRIGS